MIQVKYFTFGSFGENTYIVSDDSRNCIIIDPGCYSGEEKRILRSFIEEQNLVVEKLINTHCHIDHVLGNAFVKDTWGVDLYIHPKEQETLRSVKLYAPMYGFHQYEESEADQFIDEKEHLSFGNNEFEVLFVPGHAPGHIALLHRKDKVLIGGDVLFKGSIGRTDLPGGDFNTLIQSIKTRFFALDDDVVVYTGHGPETTIGEERLYNPFCGVHS
jgi:hydroxyacylglutathione hydrolase